MWTRHGIHLGYLPVPFCMPVSVFMCHIIIYSVYLSSFLHADSFSLSFLLYISFAFFFYELTLLLLAVSLVLHRVYLLFYMYSFPILSLLYFFLMYSDTVVNRFIIDGERSRNRNFNSIASYREMIYAMHSRIRTCIARRRHEKERTMFRLGFILALSTARSLP